jgi:putative heme iron utilization protein
VLTDLSGAEDLLAGEADALARLNREAAEALDLCAARLCGARAGSRSGRWRATGLDPEGLDLTSGDRTARLAFPEPVRNPDALRRVLQDLAERARATGA